MKEEMCCTCGLWAFDINYQKTFVLLNSEGHQSVRSRAASLLKIK